MYTLYRLYTDVQNFREPSKPLIPANAETQIIRAKTARSLPARQDRAAPYDLAPGIRLDERMGGGLTISPRCGSR